MRRLVVGVVVALLLLVAALGTGVVTTRSSQQWDAPERAVEVDEDALAARLSEAVQIRTVSHDGGRVDPVAHAELARWLQDRFPRVHAATRREAVARHSLLYTWRGSHPELPPAVLLAHQDVVGVDDESAWTHGPFSGARMDGFVWGRGTLDDKLNLVGQLEAVELLLASGFQPERTVYFAFGHDEEVGGAGAEAVAALLIQRGVKPAFVLDEGGSVVQGVMDGLAAPAALVGIAEKGYVSVEIIAPASGGHSSMPPPSTAVGRIARAAVALEARPMPARISGPTAQMLDAVAPEMSLPMRILISNRWLTRGLLKAVMSRKPSTNATLRTTTAITMAEGSVKSNVLPQRARLVVNFRILPGDTVEDVLAHVREVVDDPGLEIRPLGGIHSEATPVSPTQGAGWDALRLASRQTFPDAILAPYLTVGATDARSFVSLTDHVYRFSPMRMQRADLGRIHGTDERIAERDYADLVRFYVRFLEHAAAAEDN